MSDSLTLLEDWATGLLLKIAPAGRRKLAQSVATALRRSQQDRIKAQLDPDGAPFVPRKPRKELRGKKGRIKRAAMFAKLRTARWMKTTATPAQATVGFTGRAGRIAEAHQDGAVDAVSPGGPRVRYPQRRLLGFAAHDREMIRDILMDHLSR